MPRWAPQLPHRARQPLAVLLLMGAACAAVCTLHALGRGHPKAGGLCHPNLVRLRDGEGREVLLIGTLALDLDGASGKLVQDSLKKLHPDVVMVEGTWTAGVNAMVLSQRWELNGMPPLRPGADWTDIGDAEPVELPQPPRKRGFLGFGKGPSGPMPRWPERSLIPVKVGHWAHHLRCRVGGDMAAAVAGAAAIGVPVHFLGPAEGGFQGHMQVTLLAQQASMELLEEEHQKGSPMADGDVNAALRRAESHVLEDSAKWLKNARSETTRLQDHLRERVPPQIRSEVTENMEARAAGTAERIGGAMKAHRKGAVVLAADQLVLVEGKMKQAGYTFVSDCA